MVSLARSKDYSARRNDVGDGLAQWQYAGYAARPQLGEDARSRASKGSAGTGRKVGGVGMPGMQGRDKTQGGWAGNGSQERGKEAGASMEGGGR